VGEHSAAQHGVSLATDLNILPKVHDSHRS
jgi:hypothetical protein